MHKCEFCNYYNYDEELEDYICEVELDEDEVAHFMENGTDNCPFWRPTDEYKTARKQ